MGSSAVSIHLPSVHNGLAVRSRPRGLDPRSRSRGAVVTSALTCTSMCSAGRCTCTGLLLKGEWAGQGHGVCPQSWRPGNGVVQYQRSLARPKHVTRHYKCNHTDTHTNTHTRTHPRKDRAVHLPEPRFTGRPESTTNSSNGRSTNNCGAITCVTTAAHTRSKKHPNAKPLQANGALGSSASRQAIKNNEG